MTESLYCLVAFAAWACLLVTAIACARTFQVLTGKKRANEFPGGVQHGGDMYWRLNRAQVNTVENLPIFATLVLTAHLLHVDVTLLAKIVIGARVAQSLIHISSGGVMAVTLRFTAYVIQVACFVVMAVKLLTIAA